MTTRNLRNAIRTLVAYCALAAGLALIVPVDARANNEVKVLQHSSGFFLSNMSSQSENAPLSLSWWGSFTPDSRWQFNQMFFTGELAGAVRISSRSPKRGAGR